MFSIFHLSKANYNKGQIFPFAIAIIVLIIIMALITVNLGRIAISKTDVTNAADAAALAGASTLSGTLLGYGLTSDMQAGRALVTTVRMAEILSIGRDDLSLGNLMAGGGKGGGTGGGTGGGGTGGGTGGGGTGGGTGGGGTGGGSGGGGKDEGMKYKRFPADLVGCIWLFGAHMVDSYADYFIALNDGAMAWSNAKQRALQYAFNNAGIDEPPKVKFRDYKGTYDQYLRDESVQSGFSEFMKRQKTGYSADLLKNMEDHEIKPGTYSPSKTVSGYGWTQNPDGTFSDSHPKGDYKDKDNYVEVEVEGSVLYPIEILSLNEYFGEGQLAVITVIISALAYVKYMQYDTCKGWWCYFLWALYAVIDGACFYAMTRLLPSGFTFPKREMAPQTTDNPIRVKVTRHKKASEMGIWTLGSTDVSAQSSAHVYPESNDITIEPLLLEDFKNLGKIVTGSGDMGDTDIDSAAQEQLIRQGLCQAATLTAGGSIYSSQQMVKSQLKSSAKRAFKKHHWDEGFANLHALRAAQTQYSYGSAGLNPTMGEYVIAQEVCETKGDTPSEPTGSFVGLQSATPDEWFNTVDHLFESKLDNSFLR